MSNAYDVNSAPLSPLMFERAITRNAQLIVLLRHAMAALHRLAPGHAHTVWTRCNHEDCRKAAVLLGDRAPTRVVGP